MIQTADEIDLSVLAADVVIIGSGAAGSTLAQALEGSKREVLLIEGGGFNVNAEAQSLFETSSLGEKVDLDTYRYRVFGGSTVAWTGRCAPLDQIDFRRRDWVSSSGWPIDRGDLSAFYSEAARLIGLGDDWETRPRWFEDMRELSSRPPGIEPFIWRLNAVKRSRFMNFGKAFQTRFAASKSLRVLLEANLIGIEPTADGRTVSTAIFQRRSGKQLRVTARTWILCCGGIENPRLLMNFADDDPIAFAPVTDSLGRWFMQHPRARTADIDASASQADALQRRFNLFRRVGRHYEAGFTLSAEEQEQNGLVNASAVLRYGSRRKHIVPRVMLPVQRAPERIMRLAAGWEPRLHKPTIELHVDVEQVPDRESRVVLTPERDAIGLRKAAIDWRISSQDRHTAYHLTQGVARWIDGMGLGQLRLKPGVAETGGLTRELMNESYHHLGATRMSEGPRTGVVDKNLKVHGLANFYVCGGSVLPTGGHANPTLTLVALSLRLASHLKA